MTTDEVRAAMSVLSTFLGRFPDVDITSADISFDGPRVLLRVPTAELLVSVGEIRTHPDSPRHRSTVITCDGTKVAVTWFAPCAVGHALTITPEVAATEVGIGAHYAALLTDALFDASTYDGMTRGRVAQ